MYIYIYIPLSTLYLTIFLYLIVSNILIFYLQFLNIRIHLLNTNKQTNALYNYQKFVNFLFNINL